MALPEPAVARPRPLHDAEHHHRRAHERLEPHGGRYDDILEAVGHTPLVAIPRMSPIRSANVAMNPPAWPLQIICSASR